MFDLGGGELLLILVAVLILFGPKKLPEFAQGLGKGLRQFRQAQREFTEQINTAFEDEQRKKTAANARPGAVNTISRSAGEPAAETESLNPSTGGAEDLGGGEKESGSQGTGETENLRYGEEAARREGDSGSQGIGNTVNREA